MKMDISTAAVAYDFGADTYSCNGLAGLSSLAATSVVTQMIELLLDGIYGQHM